MYYTFRVVNPTIPVVECAKWDEDNRLLGTYRVQPYSNFCNCGAFKTCKHIVHAKQLIDQGFGKESYLWRWDEKNGWTQAYDMPEPEELEKWMATC